MIQKIRSYLLDNEEHKDSIGWFVVIVMLMPIIGMIFQYRKHISTQVGTVNGKAIEKSIFNIRLFEQKKLMGNIEKMFGEEQSQYFFNMLFQGKTLEQYILSNEIRRAFMQNLFCKLVSQDNIAGEYILLNFKKKSLDKIKNMIGELPFLLVTGQLKPSALGGLNVEMKKIDLYCEEVFQSNLLSSVFLVPLSTLEKVIFTNFPLLPIKIDFQVYSYHLPKIDIKKNKIESNNIISENELRSIYDQNIDLFQKRRNLTCDISIFEAKEKNKNLKSKDLIALNENIEKKWNELSKDSKDDLGKNIKILEDNFNRRDGYKNVKFNFILEKNTFDVQSSIELLKNLKEKIVSYAIKNQKKIVDNTISFVLIEDGAIYLISNFDLSPIEYKSFELLQDELINDILHKRAISSLELEIQQARYLLESQGVFDENCLWRKEKKIFLKNNTSISEKNNDNNFYELVSKKIASGGLRKGSTFVEIEDNVYKIYFVSELTYEEVASSFIPRKDHFYNKDIFLESLERNAKININD